MKIDATREQITITLSAAESEYLVNDIGDLKAKACGPKLAQLYQHLLNTLLIKNRMKLAG